MVRSETWLIGLLVLITSVLTLTNFSAVAEQRNTAQPAAYRPLVGYGTSDLLEIANQHGPTVRRRFLFYLELGRLAPGGRLTVFPGAGLHEERVFGLGRLAALEMADYDPDLSAEDEALLREQSRSGGEVDLRGGIRSYVIVADPPERALTLRRGSDGTLFVVPSTTAVGASRD